MTGSEHRRALPFPHFAVVGVAGSDKDGVDRSTLTLAICELVHVTNELFSARCISGGITLAEAEVLTTKAHKCVVDHYQPVLGPAHTTNLHRIAAHLLDEFRLRGNLYDGNTAYNEVLHKAEKKAYNSTNHRRDKFIEQLILVEQVTRILSDDDADRRRFCHRASLVTFKRFEGDTVWCPIETAAYDLEWPVGDLATQLFGSDGMSNG